jgi:hypothetical protein
LFRHAHALKTHGHRESTYLGVIDLPAPDTLYKVTYFASGQFPTVPLGFYEFSGQQHTFIIAANVFEWLKVEFL